MKSTISSTMSILIFLLLLSNISVSQVNFEWAQSFGGPNIDGGSSITVDEAGNVYTTGIDGSNYIRKMNPQGDLLWAKSFVTSNFTSITVDVSGNVYTTGHFWNTVDFDLGPDTLNLTSNGYKDAVVLKMDTSGNLLWAKSFGGSTGCDDAGLSIAVDASGNIYTTGHFCGTVDFNPGAGTNNLTAQGYDVFIQKLDPSGNFLWAKSFGGTNSDVGRSTIDGSGNVYTTGYFYDTVDFDPGPGTLYLTSNGNQDAFVQKMDASGNLLWAKSFGGTSDDRGLSIHADASGNVYTTGNFYGTVDFDLGVGTYNLSSNGSADVFVQKLDASGNLLWAKSFGGTSYESGLSTIDGSGNVYTTGYFIGTADFDPGPGTLYLTSNGDWDIFVQKMGASGNLLWAKSFGGIGKEVGTSVTVDVSGNVYTTGWFWGTADFDPGFGIANLYTNGLKDAFIQKMSQKKINGTVFQDFNQDCTLDINEAGISNIPVIIQPGNIISSTSASGGYYIDSLPAGTYTITVDSTNSNWTPTCPITQTFTVVHPDSLTRGPDFGFISAYPCNQPNVSIVMPQMRRGFSSTVFIQACNENTATNIMDSAYCVVELPNGLVFQSASLAHTALGNNQYSFFLDTLYPGQCVNFTIEATVSLSNSAGNTLCLEAQLYPQDSCVFDTNYNPYDPSPAGTVSPCTLPWDRSSLMVEGECVGDSVRFVIYNTGDPIDGDMDCFAPVRVYVDGQFYLLDSIQLMGGDSIVFMFEGNGSTWILQADQHPLHPGNSNPNAHVENCGTGTGDGTGVVIQFPNDDADPVIDIYCGQVTAPFDPNDKTGFPGGLGSMHYIQQNQKLEYLIRFQNVGTDTAVNVVIRDTLSTDLNIFTVVPEIASHDYEFRMYGPRILEWTFNNIMLPDSNVNEPASNGFVKFRVEQVPDLPYGTVTENTAAIYFDFEAPVITNTYFHTIHDFSIDVSVDKTQSVDDFEAVLIPNPVSDYATLHLSGLSDYTNIDIQLFDMTGRQVQAMNNQDTDKISLQVNGLTKGIYLVRVLQGGRNVGVLKMVVR